MTLNTPSETIAGDEQQRIDDRVVKTGGTIIDVAIAAVTCFGLLICLVLFICKFDPKTPSITLLMLLSGVLGASVGWTGGIIFSPYDDKEGAAFAKAAKTIYAAIAGYAVAKLDPFIQAAVTDAAQGTVPITSVLYAVIGGISFLAVGTLTYVSRRYW